MPVCAAPAVSCEKCEETHTSIQGSGSIRHSLRNGFTAYTELSPETNSSCLRRRRIEGLLNPIGSTFLRRLDTSNGCQDHTVLPYAASPVVCTLYPLTD